jgi:hypothetical protein
MNFRRPVLTLVAIIALFLCYSNKASAQSAVTITRVVPNDDSVVIEFQAVPGAVDYRVYDVNHPMHVKYAGQTMQYPVLTPEAPFPDYSHYSIEVNGIDRVNGVTLVVEAVDRLGQFQSPFEQTTAPEPCTCGPNSRCSQGLDCPCCHSKVSLNGHGDPSGAPVVIARSAAFTVHCLTRGVNGGLKGSQIWFEDFQNSAPLLKTGNNPRLPNSAYQGSNEYIEWDNGRMTVSAWGSQPDQTTVFFDHQHFMDVLSDSHGITNASMVIHPKSHFDITGDKTLHVTWEMDAHFSGRRWCNVVVTRAGDGITNPGKLDIAPWNSPTVSGDEFRWEVQNYSHFAQLFLNAVPTEVGNRGWVDYSKVARIFWDNSTPLSNGTLLDVDKRHRFDLYLTKHAFQLEERDQFGTLTNKQSRVFPDGTTLPFEDCEVSFVHQIYHSAEEHDGMIRAGGGPSLYYNYMTNTDERHWDNIGIEVLDSSEISDSTPPTVAITNPASGARVKGIIPIGVTASDAVGVTRSELYVDDKLISTSSAAGLTASWDSKTLPDGAHTIVGKAYDAYGNMGTSASVVVTVDNTPPTVAVTNPTANSTILGLITITASAQDAGAVAKTELYIDGALVSTTSGASASFKWDTIAVAEGAHSIKATAYDAAGNVGSSATVSFTVHNSPVWVTLSNPANGVGLMGTAEITASAQSTSAITRTEIYIDGTLFSSKAGDSISVLWNTPDFADGAHTVQAKAYDAKGNGSVSDVRKVNTKNRRTTLACTIASPLNGSTVSNTFTISGSAASETTRVVLAIDGIKVAECASASFSFNVTAAYPLSPGRHTVSATAFNSSGYAGATTKVTITVQ